MEEFYRIRWLPRRMCSKRSTAARRPKAPATLRQLSIIADLGTRQSLTIRPAPAHVVEKIKETISKARTDRYSASARAIPGLRRRARLSGNYARCFGVKPQLPTSAGSSPRLGSKLKAFANARRAGSVTAPGDGDYRAESYLSGFHVLRLPDGGRRHPFGAGRGQQPRFSAHLERAIANTIPKPIMIG